MCVLGLAVQQWIHICSTENECHSQCSIIVVSKAVAARGIRHWFTGFYSLTQHNRVSASIQLKFTVHKLCDVYTVLPCVFLSAAPLSRASSELQRNRANGFPFLHSDHIYGAVPIPTASGEDFRGYGLRSLCGRLFTVLLSFFSPGIPFPSSSVRISFFCFATHLPSESAQTRMLP
jgi:hypothetical protein